jgi:hypothetical protein
MWKGRPKSCSSRRSRQRQNNALSGYTKLGYSNAETAGLSGHSRYTAPRSKVGAALVFQAGWAVDLSTSSWYALADTPNQPKTLPTIAGQTAVLFLPRKMITSRDSHRDPIRPLLLFYRPQVVERRHRI